MKTCTEAQLLEMQARKEAGEYVPELEDGGVSVAAAGTPVATGLMDRMKIVRWAIENVKDLPALMEMFELFKEAKTIQERWDILKSVGDLVVDDLASFPLDDNGLFSAASVYDPQMGADAEYSQSVEEISALAEARRINWSKLFELAGTVLPVVVELLLKLR